MKGRLAPCILGVVFAAASPLMGATIIINVNGVAGTTNPYAPPYSGPVYGDPVRFVESVSPATSSNIVWNFGDGTTATSAPGAGVVHQFVGLSAATLPRTIVVSAQLATAPTTTTSVSITVGAPVVRVAMIPSDAVGQTTFVSTDAFIDGSDGVVESHYVDWQRDGVTVRNTPLTAVVVGQCGTHTASMTAHYGPYTGPPYSSTSTDAPYSWPAMTYGVRPFTVSIGSPTAGPSGAIFPAIVRASSADLAAGASTPVTYQWSLVDSSNNVISASGGAATLASIPAYQPSRSSFPVQPVRVQLSASVSSASLTSGCAPYATATAVSSPYSPPSASLNVVGCATVGASCGLQVVPTSPDTSDWSYGWTVGFPGYSSGAWFYPQITTAGTYNASVIVNNTVGSLTLAKTFTVAPAVVPSVTLTATPSTIKAGDSSVLSWTMNNASVCAVQLAGGEFGTGTTIGSSSPISPCAPAPTSVVVHPATTTTYVITVFGTNANATAQTTVTVTPALSVTSTSPLSGPTTGGTRVVVIGTGFAQGSTVAFAPYTTGQIVIPSSPIATTIVDNTRLEAVMPPSIRLGVLFVTSYALELETPDGLRLPLGTFNYVVSSPTVGYVSPSSGPWAVATHVSIHGSGFGPLAQVTVGGQLPGGVNVNSSSDIDADFAGYDSIGPVDVTVTNSDGGRGTLARGFTFTTTIAAAPSFGPISGGTTVKIAAAGGFFAKGSQVTFGGSSAPVTTWVDSENLLAVTPPHAAGAVDVIVLSPNGNVPYGMLANGFTYAAGPIIAFSASPPQISSGGSSTLSWNVSNATTVSIDNGVGGVASSGSTTVRPTTTTTYTLTATGAGGTATAQATVTVTAAAPTITFTASPPTITAGGASSLTWSVSNASSVSIDNGIGPVATAGSTAVRPAMTTTYTLTATGAGGPATAQATVSVVQAVAAKLDASKLSIRPGEAVTLSWVTSGATSATLSDGSGPSTVPLNSDGILKTPASTTTYTLQASGAGGSASSSVTVNVASPPVIGTFKATPSTIATGGSFTLAWSVSNATVVVIDNGIGQVQLSDSATIPGGGRPALTKTTVYTLTAYGAGGEVSATATVSFNGDIPPVVHGFSGAGHSGFSDGTGSVAQFNAPSAIASDSHGNSFVVDSGNHAIRKVASDGTATTVAGSGVKGSQDGCGTRASFNFDRANGSIWVNGDGSLLVRDLNGRRTIDVNGCVQTCALCTKVLLPGGVVQFNGHIYEADRGAHVVLRDGAMIAGQYGQAGDSDGVGTSARLDGPTALTVDANGVLYVLDSNTSAIRTITPPDFRVGTLAQSNSANSGGGTLAAGSVGGSMAVSGGNVYVADAASNAVKQVSSQGRITTVAGTDLTQGAAFATPMGVAMAADGSVMVADTGNHRISTINLTPQCGDAVTLCLNEDRFVASVNVKPPSGGVAIAAHAVPQTDVFGYFSFPELTGDASNPEVFVKVVGPVNGVPWIFYAGLTSLEYTITVTDRVTGQVRQYHVAAATNARVSSGNFDVAGATSTQCDTIQPVPSQGVAGTCAASSSALCLLNNRFRLTVSARDARTNNTAPGQTLPKTNAFGFYSLPGLTSDANNVEVFVKMIDASSIGGGYWLFAGGLTDFEYTLTVTDMVTGKVRTYVKPAGSTCGINDVPAF